MKKIATIDKSGMRKVILDFPKQFKVGVRAAYKVPRSFLHFKPSNIIICGMGGSAFPGEIFKTVNNGLRLTNLPILIHRDYGLPREAEKKSLIICISYSGNTEETLSAAKESHKKKIKLINIASGGRLIEFSKRNKLPFAKIPFGISPRFAFGYQLASLYKILLNLKLVKNIERDLLRLEKILTPAKIETSGQKLAKKIIGKIPLIYSSGDRRLLSYIWKIQFNENAKMPAFHNVFPELNHNEMTGIGECKTKNIRKKFICLILREKKENPRTLKRMRILSQIFRRRGIKTIFIDIKEGKLLEKMFSSILLAYWTSYYAAIYQELDPTPVELVEEFKIYMK